MKKLIIAPLMLVALFAVSSGTSGTPPAAAGSIAPAIGGCRWFCDSNPTPFSTRRDCERVCASSCEAVC